MKKYPLISIITINYKQSEVTNQLLASLKKVKGPAFEVIVVDNSGNDDYKNIDVSGNNTRLVISQKNLGFAGGNNLGIQQSNGEFILLLNNDTEVDPGFLDPMTELFRKDPTIGAVSPKIKYYQHPNIIQYAGFTSMNPFTLRMNAIGSKKLDDGSYDKEKETHFAHGCAMMIPRTVIDKVGLMPEDYFLYYEEHDWSTSIKRAGYKIFYQPVSVVLHKESISVQKNSALKIYFINRNRILYMKRNYNHFIKFISSAYLILVSIPKNTLLYLIKNEYTNLKAYWDAIIWNVTHKTKEQWKF